MSDARAGDRQSIVPSFWAEGRISERKKGKQVTVRRFGWSDESQEAAQAHADARAREAFDRIKGGDESPRFEYKRAYNGADGLPIREEVIERHGESVITRNSYGARCLNTPNVLFADVDVETGGFAGWMRNTFGGLLKYFSPAMAEDPWVRAERVIREYASRQSGGLFRLYRTPAGFRLLAMHRTFASDEPEVSALFDALEVDQIYRRMCVRQRCFRARLSAKPWRIGIAQHLGPANAAWPIKPERRVQRERWVGEYERRARAFAACRFIGEIGSGRSVPETEAVRSLHDSACAAERDLPLA